MSKNSSSKQFKPKSSDRVLSSEKGKSGAGNVDAPRAETDRSKPSKKARSATSSETASLRSNSQIRADGDEDNLASAGKSKSSSKKRPRNSPDSIVEKEVGQLSENENPSDENRDGKIFGQLSENRDGDIFGQLSENPDSRFDSDYPTRINSFDTSLSRERRSASSRRLDKSSLREERDFDRRILSESESSSDDDEDGSSNSSDSVDSDSDSDADSNDTLLPDHVDPADSAFRPTLFRDPEVEISDSDNTQTKQLKTTLRQLREEKAAAERDSRKKRIKKKSQGQQNINLMTTVSAEPLQGLTYRAICNWESSLNSLGANGITSKIIYLISDLDQITITRDLLAYRDENSKAQGWLTTKNQTEWMKWKTNLLIRRLKRIYPESARTFNSESAVARVRACPIKVTSKNGFASVQSYMRNVDKILLEYDEDSLKEEQETLVKAILKRIKDCGNKSAISAWTALSKKEFFTVEELFLELKVILNIAQQHIAKANEWLDDFEPKADNSDSDEKKRKNKKQKRDREQTRDDNPRPTQTPRGGKGPMPPPPKGRENDPQCAKCGTLGHVGANCEMAKKNHPDINKQDGVEWRDSDKGKEA